MSAYRLTLPCTRAEAEAIALAEIDGAVLVTTEEEEHADDGAGRWRLDAYFDGAPDSTTLTAVRALVVAPGEAAAVPLPDEDWVTLSQAGLEPIREGRFVVYTGAHADAVAGAEDDARVRFRIEAGQAFGTGHHETTSGCLATLEALARDGRRFRDVIDLGTGTGLLAFAALALWAEAAVTATDIDSIAIEVTRENAEANGMALGSKGGEVSLLVADGTRDPTIAERAPYDLVVANILAGPLIAMAPEIAGIAASGASVVLAGLLTTQAPAVEAAYAAAGCVTHTRLVRGDWTILRLAAGAQPVGAAVAGDREAWATDGR
ncbi:MAG: 50S ribosomal protein L11 methyltransferase [Janthinobacterium lividum]